MTQGSPRTEIDPASADHVFAATDTVTIPTENSHENEANRGNENVEQQSISMKAGALMHRTVATLKTLFGIGAPQRRPNHRRLLAGVQSLEARMVMTGDTDMLSPSDISWSEGRNDATHVLGKANILPGANLYDVSLSPDGSKAIVVGQFSKASIVDAKTGTVIAPLAGHSGSVISAAWMPDGSGFFTASYDQSVRQYSADGSLLWDSGSVGQLAVGVDVSPDGKTLFVRRHEIEPIAFDLTTKSARILNGALHLADLDAMANGKVLALENDWAQYNGPDNKVHVINPDTGVTEWTGSLHGMQPTTAVATPNGAYIFAGTEGGSIVMHNRALGTVVTVAGLGSDVRDLAMDETGTFLIAATNSSLNVFDVEPLFAGTGNAVQTSFSMGSSSVTVSGSVALINNTSLGANSRTLAIDLSQVPNMQARLDALTSGSDEDTDGGVTEETLASTIDSLEAPWSLDGENNRIAALTERALALQQAAKDLTSIADTLDEDTAEQMANALLVLIENYVTVENQVFAEGLASLSSAGQLQLQQGMEELRLIVSEIDLSSATRSHSDTSRVIDTFQIPELGGSISVHGLQGSSISALQQTVQTVEGTGVITETGRALALDFGSLTSPVLRANFTVTSSEPTDQLRVSFLSDSGVLQEQLVTSGDVVSYENLAGITGIMIENVTDVLSANAKTYLEYLRTYQSNYMYSWQDPGPRHHFFVTVRPDLASQEAAIVAEALRGEVSHPVSVTDLSLTTDLAQARDASPLSVETNGLYAEMALPKIVTFPFPYGGFGGITKVNYDPSSYNVYSLKVFGGAPEIEGVSYVDASGQNRALPSEYFEIHGNSITVFPTGQNLTIGIRVKNGTGYSPSLPVGQNYDYEVLTKSGPSMSEALPSPEARISFDAISLMTMNQGPSAGWHSGASLQYDTGSPVAVGTLKAQAQITNTGGTGAGFTVKVYSGNAGTSGWDTLQYSYAGTLAGGESRALVTPFTPMVDSEGRSFVRFVVVGDDGRILMEGGKTVGAAGGVMTAEGNRAKFLDFMKNWTTAMQQAQAETAAYFVSRGETAPTMGNAEAMAAQIVATNTDASQMPDPAMTERLLRIAMRSLVSARESGDPDRLAMEQTRFADAVSAHNAARSVAMATPNGDVVQSVSAILEKEHNNANLHGAALARADGGLMEQAYTILDAVWYENEDPDFVGQTLVSQVRSDLKLSNGTRIGTEPITMFKNKTIERTIHIEEKTMANLWVDALGFVNYAWRELNFSLSISGDKLEKKYTSNRSSTSGESISLVLEPGVYTVTLTDLTNYMWSGGTIAVDMGVDIRPRNTAETIGRVSIPERNETMPVSMRVAEYFTDQNNQVKRKTDYNLDPQNGGISRLDPGKPVWVVVHGRENSEDSSQIAELTRNLKSQDVQVVTLDWEGGAGDNLIPKVGLEGQKWIEVVGAWSANQLKSMGFAGENINVIGHSWGSYVSYEIGMHIPGGVKTLVALDPAQDSPALGGGIYKGFNDPEFKFSDAASNSYTIHSSNLGNSARAKTAEYSFEIKVQEGYEQAGLLGTGLQNMAHNYWSGGIIPETWDEIEDALREHGFAVSLFSDLLLRNKVDPLDPTATLFALENLRSDADEVLKQDGFDGVFFVDPSERINEIGKEKGAVSWVATTFGFSAKDIFGNEIYNPRTL